MALSTTQYGYIIDPLVPLTDDTGRTISNGYVRVFVAGTSTPVITFKNFDGATNEETVQLDNSGRTAYPVIGSKGSTYKVCVYDAEHSQETPIKTIDKVIPTGASINASGATIVTGLDSVTVPEENFLKATVEGTGVELALDPTEVTSDVNTISAAETAAPDYVLPLLDKTGTGDGKKISLANLFKFALDWISRLATTVTSFASGDYIAVSNDTIGARKMSKDSLLALTSQNALAGNAAPAFDPTRTSENPYLPNQWVVKDGLLYKVKNEHYGAWVAANFTRENIYNLVGDSFFATSVIPYDVLKNKYVDSSGSLVSNTHFDTFVFEVIEGDYVSFTAAPGGGYIEFVDSSFALVGSAFTLGNSYTLVNYLFYKVPTGACYIRITSNNRDVGKPTLVVHKNGAFEISLYKKLKDLKDKDDAVNGELLYIKDSLLKSAASIIVPVNRTFKNLFSNDQVGNFAINRSDGLLKPISNVPQYKAAIIGVSAGDYTISGYEDFGRWCVGLWNKDFTRIAVKTDQMTSDPDGLITIPVGETWGSASKINVSVPSDCYLIINFYNWDTKWQTAKIQIEAGTEATAYQEGIKFFPYYATLKELNDAATKKILGGKKLLIIGDSLTSLETYTDPLEANYGCYVYNRGVSGTCVAIRTGYNTSFCERFDLAENNNKGPSANGFPNRSNVDAVIVWGGINDWGHSVPLGTLEGVVDKETLFGAYKYLLEGLKTRYYGKPIIVCSVHNSARSTQFLNWNRATFNVDGSFTFRTNSQGKMLSDYHDTQKDVCDILGVTFVDMFECGVSFMSQFDLEHYSYVQGDPAAPDGLHLNEDGGKIVAHYLAACIARKFIT